MALPLSRPFVAAKSIEYFKKVLANQHQQGDGPFCEQAVSKIKSITQQSQVFLTPSCTSSLEIASMLIGISPQDEVIMPSFNFTSGAIAVTKFRGVPVFADIEPTTKCIDAETIERKINSKTRAISWVNYAGFAPKTEILRELANRYNLCLIEDNAHGLGSIYRGEMLGKTGDYVTYSFHATKNVQCGEGGALTLRSDIESRHCNFIREKGTNRVDFNNRIVDKYSWVENGSSYLLSEIQAAVLCAQLDEFNIIQSERREIYSMYTEKFRELRCRYNIDGNFDEPEIGFASHLFYIQVSNENVRDNLITFMRERGIITAFHYQALHESIAGRRYGVAEGSFLHSEEASRKLLRLPLFNGMSANDLDRVVDSVELFYKTHHL